MLKRSSLLSLFGLVLTAACYHATVETGATPSTQVINKSFASGWIFGLVPPSTVSTAAQCPSGVARVETQLSFVNQLVSFLTLGIYTPMRITVTCAAAAAASAAAAAPNTVVVPSSDPTARRQALEHAGTQSLVTRAPVYVKF